MPKNNDFETSTGAGGETPPTSPPNSDAHLTTNQGIRVTDNQNSLRLGSRGPTLIEDFVLREKIFHFDHERIPERIVHARGSAAHGYFQNYKSLADITKADLFQRAGEKTPLFTRFSTVAGGAGSVDTPRDVRGFAVKVLHKRGELGPGREQHPSVLHSGRHQISRSHPCRQNGIRSRLSAGRKRARYVLGLGIADAGIDTHVDVGDVGPRHSAQPAYDRGFWHPHLSDGQC